MASECSISSSLSLRRTAATYLAPSFFICCSFRKAKRLMYLKWLVCWTPSNLSLNLRFILALRDASHHYYLRRSDVLEETAECAGECS